MIQRSRACALLAVLALCLAACDSSSTSPTASSTIDGSRGAVIMGRVNGMAAIGARPAFDTMATAAVSVAVVGTNISTVIDGGGQFILTGVPPGDVRLRFSGSGTNATIMLTGVSATDRITITVTLNGDAARVDSEQRLDGGDGGGRDGGAGGRDGGGGGAGGGGGGPDGGGGGATGGGGADRRAT
jgi:hypothetical protein